jgi:hypothetical protein
MWSPWLKVYDVDRDGFISPSDLETILRHLVGSTLTEEQAGLRLPGHTVPPCSRPCSRHHRACLICRKARNNLSFSRGSIAIPSSILTKRFEMNPPSLAGPDMVYPDTLTGSSCIA